MAPILRISSGFPSTLRRKADLFFSDLFYLVFTSYLFHTRYQDKSSVSKERVYYEEKRKYVEIRGGCVVPKNSKPTKLRDAIKEFEVGLGR